MSNITGNKGEWSEVYVLLRLLADGKLFAADEQLNRIENMFFPIMRIIREETRDKVYEYRTGAVVRIVLNDEILVEIPSEIFDEEADKLLAEIKSQGGSGAFAIENTNAFINKLYVNKLTASSADKSDISVELHDTNTGYEQIVGFSIKSKLGSPSTLLNASGSTNFIFKVSNIKTSTIPEINAISTKNKIKDRINTIIDNSGHISFCKMESRVFQNNLYMIDSQMPEIVAQMLLGYFSGQASGCDELTKYACEAIPILGGKTFIYPDNIKTSFFIHKVKELLCAAALGMKPATPWDGTDEATGGYIIVKQDGDVVAYHIYNRDAFRGYLLKNTKFESASSSRHDYGSLYEDNDNIFIKLNLQIRFT